MIINLAISSLLPLPLLVCSIRSLHSASLWFLLRFLDYMISSPENQRLEPENHPIEIRKIIWSNHHHFLPSRSSFSSINGLLHPSLELIALGRFPGEKPCPLGRGICSFATCLALWRFGLVAADNYNCIGGFLKWWVSPTTMGFPTKKWSFWGVLGVPPFK